MGRNAQLFGQRMSSRRSDLACAPKARSQITKLLRRTAIASAGFIALVAIAPASRAAIIDYGNFVAPPGVTFGDVTESSATDAVPLYGAPTTFTTGLDFNPKTFVSYTNGAATDITDGQLNFSVTAPGGFTSLSLFEAGDYSLVGTGTAATKASAGAIFRVTVTAINGAPVTPFDLAAANGSVAFNLLANPGIAQDWTIGLSQSFSIGAGQKITGADVAIDNTLATVSESQSLAFIAKKDFRLTVGSVPEPTTAGLMMLGGAVAAVKRRRR